MTAYGQSPIFATHKQNTAHRVVLTAEERETVLVWHDATKKWSIYSDSARKGRLERWLRALGIEPVRLSGGGIEAEGIPDGAIAFKARKRRQTGGRPFARKAPVSSGPAIAAHPGRVQGAGPTQPLPPGPDRP